MISRLKQAATDCTNYTHKRTITSCTRMIRENPWRVLLSLSGHPIIIPPQKENRMNSKQWPIRYQWGKTAEF